MPVIDQHIALVQGFDSIYMGVLAMGFFYGITLCSFSCLPIIAPYIFGTQTGFRSGFDVTAVFIGARILTYSTLGAIAGWLGQVLLDQIESGILFPVAGALVLIIGITVIFKRRPACRKPSPIMKGSRKTAVLHMAVLGVATSLMPCMPLTAVLLMAATSQSPITGAVLAFTFGMGAAASPLYYLGGATSWLAAKIRSEIPRYTRALQSLSGIILAIFGLRLLLSWSLT